MPQLKGKKSKHLPLPPHVDNRCTGDHTKPFTGQPNDEMLNLIKYAWSPGCRYPWLFDIKTIGGLVRDIVPVQNDAKLQASGDSTSVAKLMECKKLFTNIFASSAAMVEPRQA